MVSRQTSSFIIKSVEIYRSLILGLFALLFSLELDSTFDDHTAVLSDLSTEFAQLFSRMSSLVMDIREVYVYHTTCAS